MSLDQITDGVVASIAYTLRVDGVEVEEATTDDPLEYLHGADNIVPGLERELTGKRVGDRFSVTLQPEDAYGEYDAEDVEIIDRSDLPETVEPGMEILIEDEEGFMYEAVVKEVTNDGVVLDFNPPLAGKVITYDVEVVALRQADDEELDHGHPHSYHDDFDYAYDDEE